MAAGVFQCVGISELSRSFILDSVSLQTMGLCLLDTHFGGELWVGARSAKIGRCSNGIVFPSHLSMSNTFGFCVHWAGWTVRFLHERIIR